MRSYAPGSWGFSLLFGIRGSVFPRALAIALPNALVAYVLSAFLGPHLGLNEGKYQESARHCFSLWAGFSSVLFFVLFFRSNVAYSRWWEGGTLLQQVRGEWFNAYSSLIAFCTTDGNLVEEVEEYQHMLSRLMSLLFCTALQQVSPNQSASFEILNTEGLDQSSLHFLHESSDKVEVILQWLQRSTMLSISRGVLTAPPPIMSRVFQELSRGIVNLQNARKIADFPFPFPYAQTSMLMLIIHWLLCPVLACFLLDKYLAAVTSFTVVFFLWCISFIALQIEAPFGDDANHLPMQQMQNDWNQSIGTLLLSQAQHPPAFQFDETVHLNLEMRMSDNSHGRKWLLNLPLDARPRPSGSEEADFIRSSTSSRRISNTSNDSTRCSTVIRASSRDSVASSRACTTGSPSPRDSRGASPTPSGRNSRRTSGASLVGFDLEAGDAAFDSEAQMQDQREQQTQQQQLSQSAQQSQPSEGQAQQGSCETALQSQLVQQLQDLNQQLHAQQDQQQQKHLCSDEQQPSQDLQTSLRRSSISSSHEVPSLANRTLQQPLQEPAQQSLPVPRLAGPKRHLRQTSQTALDAALRAREAARQGEDKRLEERDLPSGWGRSKESSHTQYLSERSTCTSK